MAKIFRAREMSEGQRESMEAAGYTVEVDPMMDDSTHETELTGDDAVTVLPAKKAAAKKATVKKAATKATKKAAN